MEFIICPMCQTQNFGFRGGCKDCNFQLEEPEKGSWVLPSERKIQESEKDLIADIAQLFENYSNNKDTQKPEDYAARAYTFFKHFKDNR